MSLTKQEIFDTVATGLVAQGVRSINHNNDCRYRGPNGTKCALGILITDDEYVREMEGHSAWSAIPAFELVRFNNHVEFLAAIQDAHDNHMPETKGGPLTAWLQEMRNIAAQYGLNPQVLDNVPVPTQN